MSRRAEEKRARSQSRIGRWRTALQYQLGIAVLLVAVAIAWFVPAKYAAWQDQVSEGKIALGNRDEIHFLDTEHLDLAGKMSMLCSIESLEFGNSYPMFYADDADSFYLNPENSRIWSRMAKQLQKWEDAGVVAPGTTKLFSATEWEGSFFVEGSLLFQCVFQTEKGAFSVDVGIRGLQGHTSLLIIAMMDTESDTLYSVGAFGPEVWNWMAQRIDGGRYRSFRQLQEAWGNAQNDEWSGTGNSEWIITDWGDLASICSAKSCEPGPLPEDATLSRTFLPVYDTFTGRVDVELACMDDYLYGYYVSLGNPLLLPVFGESIEDFVTGLRVTRGYWIENWLSSDYGLTDDSWAGDWLPGDDEESYEKLYDSQSEKSKTKPDF